MSSLSPKAIEFLNNGHTGCSTPQGFFSELDSEFHFQLDACASPENAKCKVFYTIEDDGLEQPWVSPTWVSCPWIYATSWVKKAVFEARRGITSVMLLPEWPEHLWYTRVHLAASEIRPAGRLAFDGIPFDGDLFLAVIRGRNQ